MAESSILPQIPSEKLNKAQMLKDRGNQEFKKGEWREATKCYHHSLMYAKGVISESTIDPSLMFILRGRDGQSSSVLESEKAEANQLILALSNNLAVCMLKQEQWNKVIKHCATVLQHDSNNVKALYRRGVAYLQLGQLDDSEADLKLALKIDPTDQSIRKQYGLLQEQIKLHWDREKTKYQKMFDES